MRGFPPEELGILTKRASWTGELANISIGKNVQDTLMKDLLATRTTHVKAVVSWVSWVTVDIVVIFIKSVRNGVITKEYFVLEGAFTPEVKKS